MQLKSIESEVVDQFKKRKNSVIHINALDHDQ
jgi:hypothetical protein